MRSTSTPSFDVKFCCRVRSHQKLTTVATAASGIDIKIAHTGWCNLKLPMLDSKHPKKLGTMAVPGGRRGLCITVHYDESVKSKNLTSRTTYKTGTLLVWHKYALTLSYGSSELTKWKYQFLYTGASETTVIYDKNKVDDDTISSFKTKSSSEGQ